MIKFAEDEITFETYTMPALSYLKKRGVHSLLLCCVLLVVASNLAFTNKEDDKLLFEEVKSMRASFCMYADGKFYQARSAGCTGQSFAWGYWKKVEDTLVLDFSTEDIFQYQIIKSADSMNKYQIIRIVDCYNQPVRFQFVNHDSGYNNLYNSGILKLKKGNTINYDSPVFDSNNAEMVYLTSNADTITYKWRCNRECLESVKGGDQFIDNRARVEKIVLRNKRVQRLDEFN